ncbi:MAG: hypothetical protein GX337_09385 [Christensenellaceae bacterium]|nr:hypothetical protein [Christensenellaceae bacterium]
MSALIGMLLEKLLSSLSEKEIENLEIRHIYSRDEHTACVDRQAHIVRLQNNAVDVCFFLKDKPVKMEEKPK